MSFTPWRLADRLNQLPRSDHYIVAFSGGLDSTVLLHGLHLIASELGATLAAVHVDHGLSPDSRLWARHCEAFCEERGIPSESIRLDLQCEQGESIEARAREARYRALASRMRTGDALLTAHHQDDLAETFLLRALRGSGIEGLAAITPARTFHPGWLLRPMLGVGRSELERYANDLGLVWVEDPSNEQSRFDRNYLRHTVMPVIRKRWPSASETLSRAAENCADSLEAFSEWAESDLVAITRGDSLDIGSWKLLSPPRQRAVLRHWISSFGLNAPARGRLMELRRQILEAAEDRQPEIDWDDRTIRRWRGALYMTGPLPALTPRQRLVWKAEGGSLVLPAGLGQLRWVDGEIGGSLEIRFREGGEVCRRGSVRQPLNKLFQEIGIPPWLRDRVPLVFDADELVAVADYFYATTWPDNGRLAWKKGPGWPLSPEMLQPR